MLYFISTLLNGLTLGSIYALIAVGYTMVYGIIKLINFAHGEFYMFGAFIGYFTFCAGLFGGSENGAELGMSALLIAMLIAGLATGLLAVCVEYAVSTARCAKPGASWRFSPRWAYRCSCRIMRSAALARRSKLFPTRSPCNAFRAKRSSRRASWPARSRSATCPSFIPCQSPADG